MHKPPRIPLSVAPLIRIDIKVVSNIHINRDKKEALVYGFRENHTEAKVAEAVITDESMDIGRRGLNV